MHGAVAAKAGAHAGREDPLLRVVRLLDMMRDYRESVNESQEQVGRWARDSRSTRKQEPFTQMRSVHSG